MGLSLEINYKNRYLAIFAHFDFNNLIDDYVIHYIKGLKEIAIDVIFVSDSDLNEDEILKIKSLTLAQICGKHGEYDFGSFKRGIFFAKEHFSLESYDSLILANDSCYLISSLTKIFIKMEKMKSFDFWGMTQSEERGIRHIQSYFMVFSKKVFSDVYFINFFSCVKVESSKDDIINNYELKLTQTLNEAGFEGGCFVNKIYWKNPVINNIFFNELLSQDFPFVKIEFLKVNPARVHNLRRISKFLPEKNMVIIRNHLNRFCSDYNHWEIKRRPLLDFFKYFLHWLKARF